MSFPKSQPTPLLGAAISALALSAPTASAFLLEDGTFETVLTSFEDGFGWEAFGTPDVLSAIGREDWANGAPGTGGVNGYGALDDGQFGLVFKCFSATEGGFFHDVAVNPANTYNFYIQSHTAGNVWNASGSANHFVNIDFEWYDGDPTLAGTLISTTANDITFDLSDGGLDSDDPGGPAVSTKWDDWDFSSDVGAYGPALTPPAGAAYLRVVIKWSFPAVIAGGSDAIRWDNAELTTSSLDPFNDSSGSDTVPRIRHSSQSGLGYCVQFSKDLQNFVDAGFNKVSGDGSDKVYHFTPDGPCAFFRAESSIEPELGPDRKVRAAGFAGGDADWQGFMNVSELPANGGGFVFGSGWGVADLVSDVLDSTNTAGSQITLTPNTVGDPNEFWYQNTTGMAADPTNPGGPGQLGNKFMEANLFYTYSDTVLSGQTVSFSGNVASNSLTSAHTAIAFIKDFAPDFSSFTSITAPLSPGPFNISLATDPGAGRHIQFGFTMEGENVWVTDVAPFGSVVIDVDPLVFTPDEIVLEEGTASTITWDGQTGIYYTPEYSDNGGVDWFSLLNKRFLGDGSPITVPDPSGVVPGRTYRAATAPSVPRVPAP